MSSSINLRNLYLTNIFVLDYMEPLQNGEAAYHDPDEEARIFMDQGMSIMYFPS